MACDHNGVIGNNGKMPWYYPDETQRFRDLISGQIIIMGRKTYDSMPFNDAYKVVFSRKKMENRLDATFMSSIDEFVALKLPCDKKKFMIGGADIAHQFLHHGLISEFILTKITKSYDGDVVLDQSLLCGWQSSILLKQDDYTIYRLRAK